MTESSPLSGAFIADPAPVLAALRERCPVSRINTPAGRPIWLVTGDAEVRAAFQDSRLSLATQPPALDRPHRALDRTLVNYDPPEHTRIRRLANRALSPSRIEPYRDRAAELAMTRLLTLRSRDRFDLMSEFAAPFVFDLLCEVFGIPGTLALRLHAALTALLESRAAEAALIDLDAVVHTLIGDRLGRPGDDATSAMVQAWLVDGQVTREELADLVAMLVLAGLDSTAQMIGLSMLALLTHPGSLHELRRDPTLMPSAVEELLRWDTPGPFSTRRTAIADLRIGDCLVHTGDSVLLSLIAANHDPRSHTDPDRIRLTGGAGPRHLSFGSGPHYCAGASLAKLALATGLEALIRHQPRFGLVHPAQDLQWGGSYMHRRLKALPVQALHSTLDAEEES
jgi:cytochrome P450